MTDETPEIDLDTRAYLLALPQDVTDMLTLMFARWQRIGPGTVSDARDIAIEYMRQAGDDDRIAPFLNDLLGLLTAWKLAYPPVSGGGSDE